MLRYVSIVLILVIAAWWSIYTFGGPAAPAPGSTASLDPLVAQYVEQATAAVNGNRRDREARLRLGMIYEVNGLPDLARECYEQLAARRGADARVWYRLAMLGEDQGRMDEARRSIQRAIEIEPSYAPAHIRLGYWLLEDGRFDDADAAFERALELDSSAHAALLGRANVMIQRGRVEEAIELVEARVLRSELEGSAYQTLAAAYRRAGRLEDAEEAARRARPGRPSWPDEWAEEAMQYRTGYAALRHRAEYLVSTGRYDEAEGILERLRRETGADAALLNLLGVTYMSRRRTERGLQTLREAVELDPSHYPAIINLARAYLSVSRGDDTNLDLALREVWRALDVNPEAGEAHGLHATILTRRGDQASAVIAYKEADRHDARASKWLSSALMLEIDLDRWEDALETSDRLLKRDPLYGDAHLARAIAFAELGRLDEAGEAMQRAEELPVSDPDRLAAARSRLAELNRPGAGTE